MDGFSYTDIFETKGIEYIVIIFFLILIIPFWLILNRKRAASEFISESAGIRLSIPMGIFLSRNHTWAFLESSGLAKTGIDDFLVRVTGNVMVRFLKKEGEQIRKGELMAEILQDERRLKIYSPVSGRVAEVNGSTVENLSADPYGEGWIYRLVPSAWKSETQSYLLADETRQWLNREAERFRDMVAAFVAGRTGAESLPVLQDGGELSGHPLSELPEEAWAVFEKSFLTLEVGT